MRFGRSPRAVVALAVAALVLGGCNGSGDQESQKRLEETDLKVGVLPIIDNAPLYVAIQQGFFADEGLRVTPEVVQGGALAIPKLLQGGYHVTFTNYVSVFKAQAEAQGKFHVLAEGYQAKPNVLGIVALPNRVSDPRTLAGKVIAVNTLDNVGTLTSISALRTNDVDPASVTFRAVPFQNMEAALASGQVDAAWMVEPFITNAAKALGARLVLDTATGPTADLPVAGYVSTADFAKKNPRTAAAFKRAMKRAQQVCADRQNVERVLPQFAGVSDSDAVTAMITNVGVYPATDQPSPVRLQRVADLMRTFGMVSARLDVKDLTEES